jgi:hypothetical protein
MQGEIAIQVLEARVADVLAQEVDHLSVDIDPHVLHVLLDRYNGKGVAIGFDITVSPNDTKAIQVVVEGPATAAAKFVTVASFPAITASAIGASPTTASFYYVVYPRRHGRNS